MTDGDESGDGGRTKRVTFYVSESEREALKREADQAGKSLSGYVLQLIRRQRQLDHEEELAENLNVEQRLQETTRRAADDALEEITDIAADLEREMSHLREIQAQAGTYSVVNFRALKRAHNLPEAWINDQFSHASKTLREDDRLPEPDGSDGDQDGGSDLTDRLEDS